MIYDVAVLGAGPAGANAALSAAAAGCFVALIDEQPQPGGQVWRAKSEAILNAPTTPESAAGDELRSEIAASTVTLFGGHRLWQIERAGANWKLHSIFAGQSHLTTSKTLVLATGAREYVQPFPGWTMPGVIGLAGATALMKQEQLPPGEATIVSGTGPLVFYVASEIRRLGGTVKAVITPNSRLDWLRASQTMTSRPDLLRRGATWLADLTLARVPIYWQHHVIEALGEGELTGVVAQRCDTDWHPTGAKTVLTCDSACVGHGLIPNTEAAQLLGLPLQHRPDLGGWVPEVSADGRTAIEGLFICGDGAGIRGAAAAELHGRRAGASAARAAGAKAKDTVNPAAHKAAETFGLAMTALSIPRPGLASLSTPETILCRCESLTQSAILAEIESGAVSTNAVKSGQRAGMGPCGGKFCQNAIARLIAQARAASEADIPPPTARPPLRPVPLGTLAGDFDYDALPIPKPAPL